ncbi:hypothetical protein [Desulfobacter vibrioformis]|uniref:hypothetical protein n=1 Tax=Desulfobacter vibrioformis TaxID=34031 RepID=UPI0005514158|nr:hypothetical protein [Desulfobacter vibrioformis]
MAYHITTFVNESGLNSVTANPEATRDTYFLSPGSKVNPQHPPLLNTGTFGSYSQAFPKANWIYTGVETYAFWDSGDSEIFAATQQDPNTVQVLYKASAGNLTLTINKDGSIAFTAA